MSDFLVVYYSRTGKTRIVAEKLVALLEADSDEITESKDRSGSLGFVIAAKDTLFKKATELTHIPDPAEHKIILIGMPVWAARPPPPIRTYIEKTRLTGKTVCAFCTSDSTKGKGTFNALNKLLPIPLAATFEWIKPKTDDPKLDNALNAWANEVRALTATP